MRTLTIIMPLSDHLNSEKIVRLRELNFPKEFIQTTPQNRTRIVADALEPWLQVDEGEGFISSQVHGEKITMILHVKSLRKCFLESLLELKEEQVITSYR